MAKRLRERYPSLLSQEYYPYRYILQSTQVSRTGESASAFAYGLTEDGGVRTFSYELMAQFLAANWRTEL